MPKKKQAPDKGRETLEALLKVANTKDSLAEFITAFKQVVEIFSQMKTENAEERNQMNAWMVNTSKIIEKRLLELKNGEPGKTPRKGIDYFDGKPGEPGQPGKNVDIQQILELVAKQIRFPEPIQPDMAEDIRNKLELLDGDDRLHFSHIAGLEEWEEIRTRKNATFINGKGPLWGLEDVNVVGITIGQSIKWNGVQWIPYTPGSGGASGFQQPTSGAVNGTNQIFVFATAPNGISVDNGRVIQQVSSDGTINWTGTTTITLAVAPNNDIFAVC